MVKTRKLKSRKNRQTKKNNTLKKIKRKTKNSNKIYDFSKIHPASIMCI